jgi:heme/copper-type cytochrome/quinol oxidase subunit 3
MSVHADPGGARAQDVRTLSANLGIGARLLASATAFVFVAFVFAFFYLRAVNSHGDWRLAHVKPLQGYGIAILVCTIAAAVIFDLARRTLNSGVEGSWRIGSGVVLALGIAVVALQVLEYTAIHFKTASGGYASVFWGFTLVFLLFWLGAVYWVETLFAQSVRRPPASPRQGTAGTELLRPSANAAVVYIYSLVVVQLIAYVLLYLVK